MSNTTDLISGFDTANNDPKEQVKILEQLQDKQLFPQDIVLLFAESHKDTLLPLWELIKSKIQDGSAYIGNSELIKILIRSTDDFFIDEILPTLHKRDLGYSAIRQLINHAANEKVRNYACSLFIDTMPDEMPENREQIQAITAGLCNIIKQCNDKTFEIAAMLLTMAFKYGKDEDALATILMKSADNKTKAHAFLLLKANWGEIKPPIEINEKELMSLCTKELLNSQDAIKGIQESHSYNWWLCHYICYKHRDVYFMYKTLGLQTDAALIAASYALPTFANIFLIKERGDLIAELQKIQQQLSNDTQLLLDTMPEIDKYTYGALIKHIYNAENATP